MRGIRSTYTNSGEIKFVGRHRPMSTNDIANGQKLIFGGKNSQVTMVRRPKTGRMKELVYFTEDFMADYDQNGKRKNFRDHELKMQFNDDGELNSLTECVKGDKDGNDKPKSRVERDCITTSKEICKELDLKTPTMKDIYKCNEVYTKVMRFYNGNYLKEQNQNIATIEKEMGVANYDRLNTHFKNDVSDLEGSPFGAYAYIDKLRSKCQSYKDHGLLTWNSESPNDENTKQGANKTKSKE